MLSNTNIIAASDMYQLVLVLGLLSTSWGNFMFTGYYQPYYDLSDEQRLTAFRGLLSSSVYQKRQLANCFRGLLNMLFFSNVVEEDHPTGKRLFNKHWYPVGYPGPDPQSFTPKWTDLVKHKKLWYLPQFDVLKDFSTAQRVAALQDRSALTYSTLQFDAVIVGSGAGGGTVALQLAQAGYSVLILEAGKYYTPEEMTLYEIEAMERYYQNAGALTTSNKAFSLLAGATFGGGTAVNWSCSLATPTKVREEWSRDYGMHFLATPGYTTCIDRIGDILQLHTPTEFTPPNQALLRGAANLGYNNTRPCPQNQTNGCGWCCFNCKYQDKQGTNNSSIPIAINKHNVKVLTDCSVNKILFDSRPHWQPKTHDIIEKANETYQVPESITIRSTNINDRFNPEFTASMSPEEYAKGATREYQISSKFLPQTPIATKYTNIATGVECTYSSPDGNKYTLKINAQIVIVAAGALNTPLILQRSQLYNNNVGHHLRIHPVSGIGAIYPETIKTWEGAPMTTVCEQVKDLYNGYGTIIEVPSIHVGLMSFALAWGSGLGFKKMALQMKNIVPFIALNREMTSSGYVTEGANGRPYVDYNFTNFDRAHLLEGLIAGIKIHVAAGCTEVISPFYDTESFIVDPVLRQSDPKFLAWLNMIRNHGIVDHAGPLFSAHQMGTARIAKSADLGVTAPSGEVHNCTNLFIADGSVFPTASGVNPMITIMAVAQYIALNIEQRLQRLEHANVLLKENGLHF